MSSQPKTDTPLNEGRHGQRTNGDRRLTEDGTDFVLDSLTAHGIHGARWGDADTNIGSDNALINLGVSNDVHFPSQFEPMDVYATFEQHSLIGGSFADKYKDESVQVLTKTIVPRTRRDAVATRYKIEEQNSPYRIAQNEKILFLSVNRLGDLESTFLGFHSIEQKLCSLKRTAEQQGYSIVIATGPKTTSKEDLLLQAIFKPEKYRSFYWSQLAKPPIADGKEGRAAQRAYINPYPYFLERADVVTVAGVTLSTLSDPINWGKPTLFLDRKDSQRVHRVDYAFANKMANEGLVTRYKPGIDLSSVAAPDVEKTGWPEVGRQIAAIARRKLADPAIAARFPHITVDNENGTREPKRPTCAEKAQEAARAGL